MYQLRRRLGGDHDLLDRRPGYRLEPDGLPDAAGRGVEDPAWLADLLASRLRARVGRVGDADHELLLLAVAKLVGDIERERVVPALVGAGLLAVDPDGRLEVHRAEVQQDPSATGVVE